MRFTRRTGIRTRGARAVRIPSVAAPAPNPILSSQRGALLPCELLSPSVAARFCILLHAVFCGKHVFENNKNGLRQNILTPTAILFLFRGLRAERRARGHNDGSTYELSNCHRLSMQSYRRDDRRIRARDSTPNLHGRRRAAPQLPQGRENRLAPVLHDDARREGHHHLPSQHARNRNHAAPRARCGPRRALPWGSRAHFQAPTKPRSC